MSRIWVGFFYFFEIGLGLNTDGFVGGIGWDFRGEFLSIELEWVFLFYLFIYLFLYIEEEEEEGFWGWDFEGTVFLN